jgi:predicted DNA-binding WGR domain protein
LTITDVDYGLIGFYNFYRMQIIKHKSKANLYLLLTRWGKIGDGDGQHQLNPFSSFEECQKEFCKIFLENTGNSWENTDQFEIKPKKYTLIQLNERKMHKYTDFELLQDNNHHLIKLCSRHFLILKQLDIEWMPVSKLKLESLQKARDILAELQKTIMKKKKNSNEQFNNPYFSRTNQKQNNP